MVWVGLGLHPGNNNSNGSVNDLNRLGGFGGAFAQSNIDQGPDVAPSDSDRQHRRPSWPPRGGDDPALGARQGLTFSAIRRRSAADRSMNILPSDLAHARRAEAAFHERNALGRMRATTCSAPSLSARRSSTSAWR